MITIIACDKNSSRTSSISIDPKTREEFMKSLGEFEKEMDEHFYSYFFIFDTFDATQEQEQWCDEEE